MIMTDEFKPIIRDPHKSANMLEQPVAPVPVPQPPSDPIEQVLSPREVSEGLAQSRSADPSSARVEHYAQRGVRSAAACRRGGRLVGWACARWKAKAMKTWSGRNSMRPCRDGWNRPSHVFTISTVVIATSAIMSIIALAVLIVRKRWLLIAQLAVFGGICFAAAELLKPLLPRPYLINLESNPK